MRIEIINEVRLKDEERLLNAVPTSKIKLDGIVLSRTQLTSPTPFCYISHMANIDLQYIDIVFFFMAGVVLNIHFIV